MAKEEKKMAEKHEVKVPATAELIKVTDLKPKQKFLNLDTGAEDQIEVKSSKFDLVAYDKDKHGSKADYFAAALVQAEKLVEPITAKIDALLRFATSDSYQTAKTTALAGGSYLTPEMRSRISTFMQNASSTYAELTKGECFDRWLAGYKEKKPAALKILERVTVDEEIGDL